MIDRSASACTPPALAGLRPEPIPAPVIVDTCVLVAGLPTAGGPGPWACIVEGMRDGSIDFVASERLLREYRVVLARPAIAHRLRLPGGGVEGLLDELARRAHHCDPAPIADGGRAAPDPGDAHLWALLRADDRLRLLTLDRKLLAFSRMRRRVVTPGAWWRERSAAPGRQTTAGQEPLPSGRLGTRPR
ncbi:MAG: putative toxin-antitoxin system toxin component, PIN family [Pseudomonadota bacterium]